MLHSTLIMGANFRTHTVFERRNDTSTVGIVFGVGAGDDIYIQWQANFIATNLYITLFHDVQQAYLNTFSQVWQFVDAENPTEIGRASCREEVYSSVVAES